MVQSRVTLFGFSKVVPAKSESAHITLIHYPRLFCMIKLDKTLKQFYTSFLSQLKILTDEKCPGKTWIENGHHCFCNSPYAYRE